MSHKQTFDDSSRRVAIEQAIQEEIQTTVAECPLTDRSPCPIDTKPDVINCDQFWVNSTEKTDVIGCCELWPDAEQNTSDDQKWSEALEAGSEELNAVSDQIAEAHDPTLKSLRIIERALG